MSEKPSPRTLAVFAAFQAADAVACAIPLKAITEAFDRVEFPVKYRWIFPVVKGASAAGLALGIKFPSLARLTLVLLTAYFAAAVGSHVRVKDSVSNAAPAALFLGAYAFLAARTFVRQ
ncbi:MAG: DoxX family protein [Segniliparus sp.]|uniref:DoxX family protein n=1 Tax=Segniliparus sp. TaxID=2804064 RepID=UPI003F3D2C75